MIELRCSNDNSLLLKHNSQVVQTVCHKCKKFHYLACIDGLIQQIPDDMAEQVIKQFIDVKEEIHYPKAGQEKAVKAVIL